MGSAKNFGDAIFRLVLYLFGVLALLSHGLLISACIPTVAGADSILTKFFLFSLSDGNTGATPLLVGYYALCFGRRCVTTPFKNEPAIVSKLGDVNKDLVHKGLLLQGRVLTAFAIVSGISLVLSMIVLALLRLLEKRSYGTAKGARRGQFRLADHLPAVVKAFTFNSMAWILVSAIVLHQETATIGWMTQVWGANQKINAGTTGMLIHWAAVASTATFAVGLLVMLHYDDYKEGVIPARKPIPPEKEGYYWDAPYGTPYSFQRPERNHPRGTPIRTPYSYQRPDRRYYRDTFARQNYR